MLKEEEILAKFKASSLNEIKNLNLWGSDIENIDIISKMKNIEIISLSLNKISSLKPFENLQNLRELFLRKNNIKDINEIKHLKNCPNLKLLWIEENPFCETNLNYREEIINELPQLVKLDNISIQDIKNKKEIKEEDKEEKKEIKEENKEEKKEIKEENKENKEQPIIDINEIQKNDKEDNNKSDINKETNINSKNEENINKEKNEENKISENKEEEKKEENFDINLLLEEQNPVIDINSQDPIVDNTLVNNILKDVDTSQTILLNKKGNDTTISEINKKTGIQRDKMGENILKNIDTSTIIGNEKNLFNSSIEPIKKFDDLKENINENIDLDIMRSNSLINNPINQLKEYPNHPIRYPSQNQEFGEYYNNYLKNKQNYHYQKNMPQNSNMNRNSINAVLELLDCLEPIELFYIRNEVINLLNKK